ncbi:MAG TPA: hypothetical protein PKI39_08070, partial [Synergistales bacterium]|nr:hypothetical protein [Synergistales bacterium]
MITGNPPRCGCGEDEGRGCRCRMPLDRAKSGEGAALPVGRSSAPVRIRPPGLRALNGCCAAGAVMVP